MNKETPPPVLSTFSPLACSVAGICGGCKWIDRPYSLQLANKEEHFQNTLKTAGVDTSVLLVEWLSLAPGSLRDRAELTLDTTQNYRLGLYSDTANDIVDLKSCPQFSPALHAWFQEFRALSFPRLRGTVRLRVSPQGQRGLWLDFANVDIRDLLQEQKTLRQLMTLSVVEMGQRRKRVVDRAGELKLIDPVLEPWFETYCGENLTPVPLYCTVGSFTQPGFQANRALVQKALQMWRALSPKRTIEFGCGIGNFTLPLAYEAEQVDVYEIDKVALEGLRLGLEKSGLETKVRIHQGDFQKKTDLQLPAVDCLLFDPPRSGLRTFVNEILQINPLPGAIIYISCFADSFAVDVAKLQSKGYRLKNVTLLDQFPQSPHYEIIASLEI